MYGPPVAPLPVRCIACSGVCAGNSSTEPKNRTNVTRIIVQTTIMGHIILLARHQAHQKPQANERQKQRAPEAESQPQHRFREFAERRSGTSLQSSNDSYIGCGRLGL